MNETEQLALAFAKRRPETVARLLDTADVADTAAVLAAWPPAYAIDVVCRMVPAAGAAALAAVSPIQAAAILAAARREAAAALLRALPPAAREPVLTAMPEDIAHALNMLLEHPADSAAAVMRADVLTMKGDRTAGEALALVRTELARLAAFLYVTDADAHLLGTVTLRRLLSAKPDTRLQDLAQPATETLSADATLTTVIAHPGWRSIHELPVTDANHHLLGVVDYQTLRQLEDAARQGLSAREAATGTAGALGNLFSLGVYGILEGAFGGPQPRKDVPRDA